MNEGRRAPRTELCDHHAIQVAIRGVTLDDGACLIGIGVGWALCRIDAP
jgi:hypothetical protein